MRFTLITFLFLFNATLSNAQSTAKNGVLPVFDTLEEALQQVDEFMMNRDITQMFELLFNMPEAQFRQYEAQLRAVRNSNHKHADTISQTETTADWTEIVRAYWIGSQYVFAGMIIHERSDGFVILDLTFNTSYAQLRQQM